MKKLFFTLFLLLSFIIPTISMAEWDLDSSFSENGHVHVDACMANYTYDCPDYSHGMIINSNDAFILVGGSDAAGNEEWLEVDDDITLMRFDVDGNLDSSFDSDGILLQDLGTEQDEGELVMIDDQDRLVVAGTVSVTNSFYDTDFFVARFDETGALDTTFGSGTGQVQLTIDDTYDYVYGLTIDNAGRIIVTGVTVNWTTDWYTDAIIVRFTANGEIDTTFGEGNGYVTFDIGSDDYAKFPRVLDDETILIVYNTTNTDSDVGLMWLDDTGNLNTNYGAGLGYEFYDFGYQETVTDVLEVGDDLYFTGQLYNTNDDFYIMKIHKLGGVDETFGTDGMAIFTPEEEQDQPRMAMDDDDNFIIAACMDYDTYYQGIVVYRILPNGSPDTSFTDTGHTTPDVDFTGCYVSDVVVHDNGFIYVAGYSSGYGTWADFILARFHPVTMGDGNVEGSEECDDGNTDDGDGCSSQGLIEETDDTSDDTGSAASSSSSCGCDLNATQHHANTWLYFFFALLFCFILYLHKRIEK